MMSILFKFIANAVALAAARFDCPIALVVLLDADRLWFKAAHGLALADGPSVSVGGDLALVGTGPRSWLALQPGGGWRFARGLAATLDGVAAVADQSSGYAVLRLTGPSLRATLAKGVPIDLHPSAFQPGSAAVTLAGALMRPPPASPRRGRRSRRAGPARSVRARSAGSCRRSRP